MRQKKLYRFLVVALGQVLNALSKKIEQRHLNFHIQSFPSLENPEIVASIRTDERTELKDNFRIKKKKQTQKQEIAFILNKLGKQYQLDIKKVEQLPDIKLKEIPFEDYASWYVICSAFNNPFTWLNIGYLKESLRSECFSQGNEKNICMIDLCILNNDHSSNLQNHKNGYLQYMIGFQPKNV